MRRIENLTGKTLTWVQDKSKRRTYELRSDNATFACLRFERVLGSLATAETANRKWTFDRKGSLSQRVTVRPLAMRWWITSSEFGTRPCWGYRGG